VIEKAKTDLTLVGGPTLHPGFDPWLLVSELPQVFPVGAYQVQVVSAVAVRVEGDCAAVVGIDVSTCSAASALTSFAQRVLQRIACW
jgi:hypothetical protein